jgi:hypothetical protein
VQRVRVTEDDKKAFRDGFLRANPNTPRNVKEAAAATFEFAEHRSAIGQLIPGVTGEI